MRTMPHVYLNRFHLRVEAGTKGAYLRIASRAIEKMLLKQVIGA